MKPKYGRSREPVKGFEKILETKKESWPSFGQENKYFQVYFVKFKEKPIEFLKTKKNPKIMVLGAGEGKDLKLLKNEFRDAKIDVFSLTKSLNKDIKRNVINRDHTIFVALESLDSRFKKHRQLIEKLKNKYDLVIAPLSVGIYTNYPVFNIFRSSMMLRKKGQCFIEIYTRENVEKIFNKFVEVYNRQQKTKYSFEIKKINQNADNTRSYYQIIRTN